MEILLTSWINVYRFPTGLQFENNCEIGGFSKFTNACCLVPIGGSKKFYRLLLYIFIWFQMD
uniref:Eukaryotic translation initiation factor 6 n=1 Tax=Cajanus cajan TaxID=3821 RepID=A0A151RI94_CAJCA|nr:Eukaryotic translation initiation factor 6 [Cajanus cajan]